MICLLSLSFCLEARTQLKGSDKESVEKILTINESLHGHFFEYDPKLVQEDAKRLANEIDKVSNKEIKEVLKDTSLELKKISSTAEREVNDKLYHKVNLGLIKLIETYDIGKKYNAYSCPMVKKKWVQNSGDKLRVHNPYAPEMPHCGQRDSDY